MLPYPSLYALDSQISKHLDDLLVLINYPSFAVFRIKLGQYFRTKRFNLNMRNYLAGNVPENFP